MDPVTPHSAYFNLVIHRGVVFKMPHYALRSPLPHYLVVVNRDTEHDTTIALTVVTSKVEKSIERAKASGCPPSTIVEFGPQDYRELTLPSCIDCNDVKVLPSSELERVIRENPSCSCWDFPASLLERVTEGILDSPRVPETIKSLVRPRPPTPAPVNSPPAAPPH